MSLPAEPCPVLLMCRELGLGGSERQLCEIAKALDRTRFEPHVGCYRAQGFRADDLRAAGVPVVEFPVRSLLSLDPLREAFRVGRYLAGHRIQLVHTFDTPLNIFGVPTARLFRVPVVLSSRRATRQLVPPVARPWLHASDQLADGVVVNCEALRAEMAQQERMAPGAVRVCYNGVDTALFQPGQRCRPAPLRDSSVVIGVVCGLRPEKGLETLLEAFARVRGIRQGLRLVLVGDGTMRSPLQAQADRLRLGPDCHFAGATADVAGWLRAIDIFVLPSLSEALSNSLLEAMASGCCAVASDVGGNPELVRDGETGLLFPPGNAAALAESLSRVLLDDAFRQRLAETSTGLAQREFSIAKSARRMEEIYDSFLGRH